MDNQAIIATCIFAVAMLITVIIGIWSGRGREKSMDEWSISGRGLGFVFVLMLMAGDTYTSFSFLGAAGWSYDYGVPILYLIAYLCSGLVLAYCLAPLLWSYASRHGLVCLSDIVEHRFQSRGLGILITVLCTIFLIPYIQLQIQGMGTVVNAMTYGAIELKTAGIISFVVAETFILVSGLRGSAWVSVLKDSLVVLSVVFMAVYIPLYYFQGVGQFMSRLIEEKSEWLTFPGHGSGTYGLAWFISTVILNAVTLSILPTTVASYLSASSPNVLRRNSMILPWYQLLLLVPMAIGTVALFVVPKLPNSDLALYRVVIDSMPAPIVAIIGVAGALSAIVPMSVFMLSVGTMWGRTILARNPNAQDNDKNQKHYAQGVCLIVGFLALAGTLFMPGALVNLSVLSYEGIAQLVPAALLSLYFPQMSKKAVISGLLIGSATMLSLHYTGLDPLWGINGGLIALVLNIMIVTAMSLQSPAATKIQDGIQAISK